MCCLNSMQSPAQVDEICHRQLFRSPRQQFCGLRRQGLRRLSQKCVQAIAQCFASLPKSGLYQGKKNLFIAVERPGRPALQPDYRRVNRRWRIEMARSEGKKVLGLVKSLGHYADKPVDFIAGRRDDALGYFSLEHPGHLGYLRAMRQHLPHQLAGNVVREIADYRIRRRGELAPVEFQGVASVDVFRGKAGKIPE